MEWLGDSLFGELAFLHVPVRLFGFIARLEFSVHTQGYKTYARTKLTLSKPECVLFQSSRHYHATVHDSIHAHHTRSIRILDNAVAEWLLLCQALLFMLNLEAMSHLVFASFDLSQLSP